jgi:hypothetical protein
MIDPLAVEGRRLNGETERCCSKLTGTGIHVTSLSSSTNVYENVLKS